MSAVSSPWVDLRACANRRVEYVTRSYAKAIQSLRELPSAKSFQPIGAASKPGLHRFLRTSNDSMENPHHSSSSVALDDLSDHEALRQKEPGTSSPSGAKRLAQYAQSLLGVGCQPISAKQKAPKRSTSAHTHKERANQAAVAPHLHHAA